PSYLHTFLSGRSEAQRSGAVLPLKRRVTRCLPSKSGRQQGSLQLRDKVARRTIKIDSRRWIIPVDPAHEKVEHPAKPLVKSLLPIPRRQMPVESKRVQVVLQKVITFGDRSPQRVPRIQVSASSQPVRFPVDDVIFPLPPDNEIDESGHVSVDRRK